MFGKGEVMHEKELEVLDVKGVVAENDKLNKRIKKALPVVFHALLL